MTHPLCTSRGCDELCPDQALLCQVCTGELFTDLHHLTTLVGDLQVTFMRLAVMSGKGSGSRSAETALPYHDRAAKVLKQLEQQLHSWAADTAAARGIDAPFGDAVLATIWLRGQVTWLRRSESGVQIAAGARRAVTDAMKAIDRPEDGQFLGPCDRCDVIVGRDGVPRYVPLVAKPNAKVAQCPRCGTNYDVDVRRRGLLVYAYDHLATATQIARALNAYGDETLEVSADRIYQWAHRKRLLSRGREPWLNGKPLYRVGDVIDLLNADAAARERREAKKEARAG